MSSYSVVVILHLLGASIWVGGHLVLALGVLPAALRASEANAGAGIGTGIGVEMIRNFENVFEKIGVPALLLQVASGLWLAHFWVPDWHNWLSPGTAQARWVAVKLFLLLATLLLAMHARLKLIPNLTTATLPALAWHIRLITLVAVLFLLAGASLRTGVLP